MLNERTTSDKVVDVVSIVAGAFLFLGPWLFGFAAETGASWNAWIAGLAIAIVGIWTLASFHNREEWVNLALGVWTLISPWLLGFAAVGSALAVHVVVGSLVAVIAAVELWRSNNRPMSTA
jgi:hypothetical protein